MNMKTITATLALALGGALLGNAANAELVIHCNRGPIPSNPLINGSEPDFVSSLMRNFVMTEAEAQRVAREVCGDMVAVGDLNMLVDLTYEATAPYERRQ